MEIKKKETGRTGKFIAFENEKEVADVSWLVNDESNYVIDHTSVTEEKSGQGIGKDLIDAVVDMARENNKKIIPGCAFARKIFERHEQQYADIWDKRDN